MHTPVNHIFNMRTTITIPASLIQKLVKEAARRNAKGYSQIIEDALVEYFSKEHSTANEDLKSLRGCMPQDEFTEAAQLLNEGRANWKM